jgi:outer membrane lipoprotein-sorting protein
MLSKKKESDFILRSLLVFIMLTCAVVSTTAAADGILDDLIKKQSALNSVIAMFVQEKYDPLLGRAIKSEGKFYFRPGVGVRWEYEDVLVIYDGTVLYVYSPDAKEAEKIEGKQGFMGPLAFDVKVLMDEYEIEAVRIDDNVKLNLKPKTEMPFQSLAMIFRGEAPFPSEVSITEVSGDTSVIRFDKVKINKRVSDELFVFKPPPGTTINERTFE